MAVFQSRSRVAFLSAAVAFILAVFVVLGFAYFLLTPAGTGEGDFVFLVNEGSTLNQVAGDLEKEGLISSRGLFMFWARITGKSRDIKAGEYSLNTAMPPVEILEKLSRGKIITHPVTIPEGFTARHIADILEREGLAASKDFIPLVYNPETADRYGIEGPGLEGYLYPDTYYFARGLSARSIIDTMVRRFFEVFGPFKERVEERGLTMEEVVTLASIVEKETGLAEERPLIASVFLNRLERGMRLEADPTVIYGLEDFDGNLTRKHLSEPTPYNTYVINGLPPGPIANPGKAAIKAVLYPAETEYLYFVAKKDGSHHFSRTLSEHNRAVYTYQKR